MSDLDWDVSTPEPAPSIKAPTWIFGGSERNVAPLCWNDSQNDTYDPSALFDTIIEIKVGDSQSQKTFSMHKGLLCYHSSHFEAQLTGPWSKSSRTGKDTIMLENESINAFERFNCWIYSGLLKADWSTEDLLETYIFAEMRIIPRLQNALVNRMLTLVRNKDMEMRPTVLNHAWKNTIKLQPFLIDAFVFGGDMDEAHKLSYEFLAAVARRSNDLYKQGVDWCRGIYNYNGYFCAEEEPFSQPCERYHVHEEESPSCNFDQFPGDSIGH